MDYFLIRGGRPLHGTVEASGAKNASLPALAATTLTGSTVELSGLPGVADVRTMTKILGKLGARLSPRDDAGHTLSIATPSTLATEVPYDLVKTMRASVLFLGPLLSRFGHVRISLPGGCAIGNRPINYHVDGLRAMGAQISLHKGFIEARCKRLQGTRFRFENRSVTGTENLLMAASLADGPSVLENCAREPEITDLGNLLTAMGAKIDGLGTDTIRVEGADELGGARHTVIPDRIEIGTYLIAALITGGELTIKNVRPEHLDSLLRLLRDIGAAISVSGDTIRIGRDGPLRPRGVLTEPYPGFPTDLQAQYMALATQIEGVTEIREGIFEGRFLHASELARMGASIDVDGPLARVEGGTALEGAEVMATDLRASACLVLAGLAASGETAVHRIYHLDRGYEQLEQKFRGLGAEIQRKSGD